MRQLSRSKACLVSVTALLMALTQALAEEPLVAMDLPSGGPLATSAQACYDQLQRQGFDVWWLREREPRQRDHEASVLLFNTSAPLPAEQRSALPDFVRDGGGVVVVAEGAADRLEATRSVLELFDVKTYGGPAEAQAVQLRSHPVTAGISDLGLVRADVAFSASGVEVLASQGARPVAVAGTLGQGRFVIVLDNLVSLMADAPTGSGPVALLTQAVTWVAGRAGNNVIRLPDDGPLASEPANVPASAPRTTGLSGTAVVELGSEADRWPEIRRIAESLLDASGLSQEPLRYKAGEHTLADALAALPSLVVLGAVRPYEEVEQAAFGQYIWNGGSALVLAYCTPRTVAQLQSLNRVLATVNLATTFGRPGGTAAVAPGPLTSGLNGWKGAPAGLSVWALSGGTMVSVNKNAVAATQVFGEGRVVICDATLLLPPAKARDTDGSQVLRDLLARSLGWLVSAPEDAP